MAITLDGTTGITTPDVDTDGLTVDTNTLFVDAASNRVGVGTSSPAATLDVVGAAATAGLKLRGGGNSGVNILDIADVGGAGQVIVNPSGNLLVGATSSPVAGKIASSFLSSLSQFGAVFIDSQSNNTAIFAQFRNASAAIGSITNNNNTGTSYNTSSDYRLKENVVPLAGAADRLMQIPVHRFNFIADPDRTVDGFLAHEVQEFVPECVTGQKDEVDDEGKPVHQGIDQSKLTPLLTAALQEALQKIDNLTARISALETSA